MKLLAEYYETKARTFHAHAALVMEDMTEETPQVEAYRQSIVAEGVAAWVLWSYHRLYGERLALVDKSLFMARMACNGRALALGLPQDEALQTLWDDRCKSFAADRLSDQTHKVGLY